MPHRIKIIHGDLTKQTGLDAIVTALPMDMDVRGAVNQAIIRAAGKADGGGLDEFLLEHIFKPQPGDVVPIPGFELPVKYILYVITPAYKDDFAREDRDVLRCYRHATQMAVRMGLGAIGFPAIGTGARFPFPAERAARLAVQGITERIAKPLGEVRIVCNDIDIARTFAARLKRARAGAG